MSRAQELEQSHAMRSKDPFPKLTDRRSQLVGKKPIRSPNKTTMGSVVQRSKPKLISSDQNPYLRKIDLKPKTKPFLTKSATTDTIKKSTK